MKKLILLVVTLFTVTLAWAHLPFNYNHIYFFGDSLTDMGNYAGTYPDEMDGQQAPVTNWEKGSMTKVGKTTWAEFLAETYTLHATPGSKNKPQGNDWAVSGANTIDIYGQVTDFLNSRQTYPDPNTTLYVIWAGANDLLGIHSEADVPRVLIGGMFNIANMIQSLHNTAHAKNFLIVSMPDISVTPLFSNPNHVGSEYSMKSQMMFICNYWNLVLYSPQPMTLEGQTVNPPLYLLKTDYPDLNIYTFNTVDLLDNITSNPSKYGFQSSFDFTTQQAQTICGADKCNNNQLEWYYAHFAKNYGDKYSINPDMFIFHNSIHPTTHAHELLANNLIQGAKLFTLDTSTKPKVNNLVMHLGKFHSNR